MTAGSKPRVGTSACLLGREVRYNGAHKRHDWLVDVLGPEVEWVPVCPEVELGLGVPREPIRLVTPPGSNEIRLMGGQSHRDLTEAMRAFAAARVEALAGERLSGFVFKTRSPSCGLTQVEIVPHPGAQDPGERGGPGFFAAALVARFPDLPVIEEHTLADPAAREAFRARVWAHAAS